LDIPLETLQAVLDQSWANVPAGNNTFVPYLLAQEQARLALFSTTGSIGSVAKNSTSQSFTGPSGASLTVLQMQKLYRMLINLYRQKKQETDRLFQNSVAWFISKFPTYATNADPAVYDFMVNWLGQDFTQYQCDMTDLRMEPTLAGEGLVTW
jgi:hypothetical protein